MKGVVTAVEESLADRGEGDRITATVDHLDGRVAREIVRNLDGPGAGVVGKDDTRGGLGGRDGERAVVTEGHKHQAADIDRLGDERRRAGMHADDTSEELVDILPIVERGDQCAAGVEVQPRGQCRSLDLQVHRLRCGHRGGAYLDRVGVEPVEVEARGRALDGDRATDVGHIAGAGRDPAAGGVDRSSETDGAAVARDGQSATEAEVEAPAVVPEVVPEVLGDGVRDRGAVHRGRVRHLDGRRRVVVRDDSDARAAGSREVPARIGERGRRGDQVDALGHGGEDLGDGAGAGVLYSDHVSRPPAR